MHCNAVYYIDYLDYCLRACGKGNMLEENVCILLSGVNIIALIRAHATCNEAITVLMRWLAANSHKLKNYN